MTFAEQVEVSWSELISRHKLRVESVTPSMVYVVVSSISVIMLVFHPSHGGVDMRWAVRARAGWSSYAAYNLLWQRSSARPSVKVKEGLEGELGLMAWKLEEVGEDMLRGDVAWTRQYQQSLGSPTAVLAEVAAELEREAGGG